jgi:hypothetical protein
MRLAARHMHAFPARLLGLGPEDELPGVMEQWMDWNLRGHWTGRRRHRLRRGARALHTLPLLFMAGAGDHRFAPPARLPRLFDLVGADAIASSSRPADATPGSAGTTATSTLSSAATARREIWPLLLDWLGRYRRRGPGPGPPPH